MRKTFDIPHTFTQEVARQRLQRLTTHWQNEVSLACSWADNRCTVSGKVTGFSVKGELTVEAKKIRAKVEASVVAVTAGKAYVEKMIRRYLDPGSAVEEL